MGFVPFFIVISGVIFLVLTLNYHTFRNYRDQIRQLIARIEDVKKQVRTDVDELEFLSVPELEGFCENMCGYLSGRLEGNALQEKMNQVNHAFSRLYSDSESKHIQEEILKSINSEIDAIGRLHAELRATQYAYEKLLNEKPYSMLARWMHFEPVQIPWEKANTADKIPA